MRSAMLPDTAAERERGRLNRVEGEEIWRRKRQAEELARLQEVIKTRETGCYWPFGLPGCGAPNPGSIRRQRLKLPAICQPTEAEPDSLSRQRRWYRTTHPELRYQGHPDVRRSVDIRWRYAFPSDIKEAYRRELERQMAEKRQSGSILQVPTRRLPSHQSQTGLGVEFGRPGPGGRQWRHPARVGMNFLHSLGWTGEKALRRLEQQLEVGTPSGNQRLMIADRPHSQLTGPEEAVTGGVELVPLMARRRSFKKTCHLPTSDATNVALLRHGKEEWADNSGPLDYLRDLNSQVSDKIGQVKKEKEEDVRSARKHFETWNSLWGRPGHGAPRAGGAKGKGHLGRLLYREQGELWPSHGAKMR